MKTVVPVLLAGGTGTRLWPLSRKSYPKQFIKHFKDISLFQACALRFISTKKINFEKQITLTNAEFRFIVSQQLIDVGIDPGPIIIEPTAKNTAPAILSASMFAQKKHKEPVLLVAPTDHIITKNKKFTEAINLGIAEAEKGKIVTFGVTPTSPETGYGYLQLDYKEVDSSYNFLKFVEKPNKKQAEKMIKKGNYLWNSGIFLFRAKDIISAYKDLQPKMYSIIEKSLDKAKMDLGFLRMDNETYNCSENISIDFAIMEKLKNISVIPFSSGWSDLGNWEALWQEMKPDQKGMSLSSNAFSLDSSNSLLRSENKNQIIVGLGLKNIIAVAMQDAVLVANKSKSQSVKNVVEILRRKNIPQSEIFPKDHRPWGWFETLIKSDQYQVKIIKLNPNSAISLQSHKYRSEHWVIVSGTAKVTLNNDIKTLSEGESIYIPLEAIHRLENPNKTSLTIIEIQIGTYLGEDDIIRYEDKYSRN